MNINLGFFTRPWNRFDLDTALSSIRDTGCTFFGMMRHTVEKDKLGYIIHGDLDQNEINELQHCFEKHGLKPLLHFAFVDLWNDDGEEKFLREIDAAAELKEEYILTAGTSDDLGERYKEIIQSSLDYAAEKGVVITVKPHGGITTTIKDCLDLVHEMNHDCFRIFYDPANLMYYSGNDPLDGLEELIPYINGVCLKDCAGGKDGTVNICPGEGDVDFRKIFSQLHKHNFHGPCLIENLGGTSLEEINTRAAEAVSYFSDL